MKTLRVAVVAACPFPYPRGTPIRAVRLSEALARLGHDVHVATYHVGIGALDPRLRLWRIRGPAWLRPLRPGPSVGKIAILDPLLYRRLRRMLSRVGPFDVIHAHHYEGLLLALAARRRSRSDIPVIYDAHTLLASELPTYGGLIPRSVRALAGKLLDAALPRRADHVIAVSELLRDRLLSAKTVAASRVTAVGNGVEPEAFVPVRRRSSPPTDGGAVVYAGNLAEYHRIDLLLDAFARLRRHRPHAKLRIHTESDATRVLEWARGRGIGDGVEVSAVSFPRLGEALATADVAVNPRPSCDGVPQKNLNYMAAGLPLVAFRESLHPCSDGETGVAAESVDAGALAAAIDGVLARPAHAARLGEAARHLANTEFSWETAARRVEEVYRSLVDQRPQATRAPALIA